VRLLCGTVVLSEADNWYVPARLSPEINKQLDTTDTPFGRAVQQLHFHRHTISATVEHRAVLTLPDGTPFSEVVETYTGNVLAFESPRWRNRRLP
jgi:hypothetical protein